MGKQDRYPWSLALLRLPGLAYMGVHNRRARMEQWQHQNIAVKHFAKPPLEPSHTETCRSLPRHTLSREPNNCAPYGRSLLPLCQGKTKRLDDAGPPTGLSHITRLSRLVFFLTDLAMTTHPPISFQPSNPRLAGMLPCEKNLLRQGPRQGKHNRGPHSRQ